MPGKSSSSTSFTSSTSSGRRRGARAGGSDSSSASDTDSEIGRRPVRRSAPSDSDDDSDTKPRRGKSPSSSSSSSSSSDSASVDLGDQDAQKRILGAAASSTTSLSIHEQPVTRAGGSTIAISLGGGVSETASIVPGGIEHSQPALVTPSAGPREAGAVLTTTSSETAIRVAPEREGSLSGSEASSLSLDHSENPPSHTDSPKQTAPEAGAGSIQVAQPVQGAPSPAADPSPEADPPPAVASTAVCPSPAGVGGNQGLRRGAGRGRGSSSQRLASSPPASTPVQSVPVEPAAAPASSPPAPVAVVESVLDPAAGGQAPEPASAPAPSPTPAPSPVKAPVPSPVKVAASSPVKAPRSPPAPARGSAPRTAPRPSSAQRPARPQAPARRTASASPAGRPPTGERLKLPVRSTRSQRLRRAAASGDPPPLHKGAAKGAAQRPPTAQHRSLTQQQTPPRGSKWSLPLGSAPAKKRPASQSPVRMPECPPSGPRLASVDTADAVVSGGRRDTRTRLGGGELAEASALAVGAARLHAARLRAAFAALDLAGCGVVSKQQVCTALRYDGEVRRLLHAAGYAPSESPDDPHFTRVFGGAERDSGKEVTYAVFEKELLRVLRSLPASDSESPERRHPAALRDASREREVAAEGKQSILADLESFLSLYNAETSPDRPDEPDDAHDTRRAIGKALRTRALSPEHTSPMPGRESWREAKRRHAEAKAEAGGVVVRLFEEGEERRRKKEKWVDVERSKQDLVSSRSLTFRPEISLNSRKLEEQVRRERDRG
eukprot:Hpha_TRINITY_DN16143_c5_g9::TRINITY_DN16143_c5_g9_i1::g.6956::m.6956